MLESRQLCCFCGNRPSTGYYFSISNDLKLCGTNRLLFQYKKLLTVLYYIPHFQPTIAHNCYLINNNILSINSYVFRTFLSIVREYINCCCITEFCICTLLRYYSISTPNYSFVSVPSYLLIIFMVVGLTTIIMSIR